MKIKRGDIYWMNFNPHICSEQAWIRPALIVQNNIWNQYSNTVIVLAISSRLKDNPTNVLILPTKINGLSSASTVKVNQIFTVDKKRLGDRLWSLSLDDLSKVDWSLKVSLDI